MRLQVYIADSDMFLNRARAKRLLRLFREEDPAGLLQFEFNTCGYFDAELARLANRRSFEFYIGLESTNVEALRASNRRYNLIEFQRGMRLLRRYAPKAPVAIQLMLGLPGDTLKGFRRSLDWALDFQPDLCHVFHVHVLPGSGFSCEPSRFGLAWENRPPYRVISTGTFSQTDIREARKTSYLTSFLLEIKLVRTLLKRMRSRAPRRRSTVRACESLAAFIEFERAYSFSKAFAKWNQRPVEEQTPIVVELENETTARERTAILRSVRRWAEAVKP